MNITFDKIGTSSEVYLSGVDDAIDEKGNTEANREYLKCSILSDIFNRSMPMNVRKGTFRHCIIY